ncbi:hypothetical protein GGI16_002877, partial [Coemansia sp. S142-1]
IKADVNSEFGSNGETMVSSTVAVGATEWCGDSGCYKGEQGENVKLHIHGYVSLAMRI